MMGKRDLQNNSDNPSWNQTKTNWLEYGYKNCISIIKTDYKV